MVSLTGIQLDSAGIIQNLTRRVLVIVLKNFVVKERYIDEANTNIPNPSLTQNHVTDVSFLECSLDYNTPHFPKTIRLEVYSPITSKWGQVTKNGII